MVLLAGIGIGLWRGSLLQQNIQVLDGLVGQEIEVAGVIAEDVSIDVDGDIRFRLEQLQMQGEEIDGSLWASVSEKVDVKRSDIVVLRGRVSEGFGTIPIAMYRASIISIERQDYADVARDTRDWFAGGIREGVREPEASLGSGFLLGQKTALPEKLDIELQLLGLTHIVVASGYNLSILVRYSRRLFARISRFTALASSGILVWIFANITGFGPSMTRASVVTLLGLFAWYFGRKFHPFVLLSVSAAFTVMLNPTYAWGDIGWLLSFTSFIGVIILAPLIRAYFWGKVEPGNLQQILVETFSAQLLTLPIVSLVFEQYSPLALLANMLILPLIPAAMLLTFFAGIAGVLVPAVASIVGIPAEVLLGYMTVVVDWLARQPLAVSDIQFSLSHVIAGYLALLCLIVFLWRRTGYSFRDYNIVE